MAAMEPAQQRLACRRRRHPHDDPANLRGPEGHEVIRHTLTIQERHLHELRKAVLPPSGHEGIAYLLCGRSLVENDPWERDSELRHLSREVIALAPEDLISSSPDHVRARTATL